MYHTYVIACKKDPGLGCTYGGLHARSKSVNIYTSTGIYPPVIAGAELAAKG